MGWVENIFDGYIKVGKGVVRGAIGGGVSTWSETDNEHNMLKAEEFIAGVQEKLKANLFIQTWIIDYCSEIL